MDWAWTNKWHITQPRWQCLTTARMDRRDGWTTALLVPQACGIQLNYIPGSYKCPLAASLSPWGSGSKYPVPEQPAILLIPLTARHCYELSNSQTNSFPLKLILPGLLLQSWTEILSPSQTPSLYPLLNFYLSLLLVWHIQQYLIHRYLWILYFPLVGQG